MSFNKVFQIGLNKTGTTSLHKAFEMLNLKSCHFEIENGKNIKNTIIDNYLNNKMLLNSVEYFDCYTDWLRDDYIFLYKILDIQYPGSKFILTVRDIECWLESRTKHVIRNRDNRSYKGGWVNIDKEAWRFIWSKHVKDVKKYFHGRRSDLLIIDVSIGNILGSFMWIFRY